jgi:2-succinyl-5-enolpyruvyl-6-hydroxy-3-cyclohexene-1-carboxylate synthase
VAGAAGAAAATARPGALLLGDVSLLHDLGGLDVAADLDVPLAIVVLDNGGGRIFEQLPFAERRDPQLLRYWLTPPRLRFEAVAEAFGLRFRSAGRSLDLGRAVREALDTPAATLIHARIAGDHTVTVQEAIWRAVEKAVAEAPAPDRGTVA